VRQAGEVSGGRRHRQAGAGEENRNREKKDPCLPACLSSWEVKRQWEGREVFKRKRWVGVVW